MPASPLAARPVFCLVTDRRALAEAIGGADTISSLTDQIKAAVDAGVDLVHLRERDLEAGTLAGLAARCVALAQGSSTRIVVNDRLDVALAVGAHGVHLRGDSVEVGRLRTALEGRTGARTSRAASGFLLGASVRGAEEARHSTAADYLVFGTVFATPSKPGLQQPAGLEELARAVRATRVPVLAIGGIAEDRLAAVARTGASGIAAIRLFFPGPGGWRALPKHVERWRRLFDTTGSIT